MKWRVVNVSNNNPRRKILNITSKKQHPKIVEKLTRLEDKEGDLIFGKRYQSASCYLDKEKVSFRYVAKSTLEKIKSINHSIAWFFNRVEYLETISADIGKELARHLKFSPRPGGDSFVTYPYVS